MKTVEVGILVCATLARQKGKKSLVSRLENLFNECTSQKNVASKSLSGLEAAALRKYVDLSASQWQKMTEFLNRLSKKKKELGEEYLYLKIFPSYWTIHKVDVETMPSNCEYVLLNKSSGESNTHKAVIDSKPLDIIEESFEAIPNSPVPNIRGCFFPITDIIAKELETRASLISCKMLENSIDTHGMLESFVFISGCTNT